MNASILPMKKLNHRDLKSLFWSPQYKGAEPGLGARLCPSEPVLSRSTCIQCASARRRNMNKSLA